MNTDVEFHIRQNYPWNKLPANVKQVRCLNVSSGHGERGDTAVSRSEPVNVTGGVLAVTQAATTVALLAPRPLQGFHRPTGAIADRYYTTAIEATLESHDRLFDWWGWGRHMILACDCHLQIQHLRRCAQCILCL